MLETIAAGLRARMLSKLLFPAFGGPIKATLPVTSSVEHNATTFFTKRTHRRPSRINSPLLPSSKCSLISLTKFAILRGRHQSDCKWRSGTVLTSLRPYHRLHHCSHPRLPQSLLLLRHGQGISSARLASFHTLLANHPPSATCLEQ